MIQSLVFVLMSALLLSIGIARAEPFLAVESGFQCGQCHVNPTGGGKRNAFGSSYSQTTLPARTGSIDLLGGGGERISFGADFRAAARQRDDPLRDDVLDAGTDRLTAYISARLNESTQVYVDQQFAPGGSLNREAWAKFGQKRWYVKVGRFFQPYGWRLEDDSAFIRSITNVNFNTPDNGVEFGYVDTDVSAQFAVTNGTGGAPEIDDGKQVTARVAWAGSIFRLGVSASRNDTDVTDRRMFGAFGGIKTGPVAWIFEFDRVEDDIPGGVTREQNLGLVEANWRVRRGHYVKVTAERRSSRTGTLADRERHGVEYQWFPLPFMQLRVGYRDLDVDSVALAGVTDEAFLQLHLYF